MKSMKTKNNCCVLYLRYSTDKQKEESIEYQRAECEKFCELNGYEIIDEYVDRAHTACNSNRKNYIRLLKDAHNDPDWNNVIVYSFSRIFRNLNEALTQEALLSSKGIQLLSVKEHYDNTMEGTLMRVVQHYVDAKQPQKCAEHTHSRLKQKALKSEHCGGTPPLGYDIVNKKLVINHEEAETVRKIFDMYINGYSYMDMAEKLNLEGRKTKANSPFKKNSFSSILKQKKYIGTFVWNRASAQNVFYQYNNHLSKPIEEQIIVENGCPAIIDEETFNKVQEILEERSNGRAKNKGRHHYMLSGLKILKCKECGAYLIGSTRTSHGNLYRYYNCPNHKKNRANKDVPRCPTKELRADYLEEYIGKTIVIHILNRKLFPEYNELLKSPTDHQTIGKLRGTQKAIENILKAIEKSGGDDLLLERLSALKEEKKALESSLHQPDLTLPADDIEIKKFKTKFVHFLTDTDTLEIREFLKTVIVSITLDNDGVDVKLEV